MIQEHNANGQKYYHHKDFHHHHAPTGSDSGAISLKKSTTRKIKVVRRVLDANQKMAEENRRRFAANGVFVLNVMSSPGSGKTTTLEKTLVKIMPEFKCAVIVGDICTTHDADRLATTGAPVVQVNTDEFGGDCHLAAHVIEKALGGIDLHGIQLLIVENVGNLVCPAEFNVGEDHKVMMLSVTEGDDKPYKYPLMFRESRVLLISKVDLLPHLRCDIDKIKEAARSINPDLTIFEISSYTGQGLDAWHNWIREQTGKN